MFGFDFIHIPFGRKRTGILYFNTVIIDGYGYRTSNITVTPVT